MLKGCNELISRIISQTDYCLAWKRGSAPVSTLTHAIAAVAFVVKCREDTSFNALPCSMEARVQNYCLCDCAVRSSSVASCGDSGKVLGGQAILGLNNNLVTLLSALGLLTDSFPSLGHQELSIQRAANLINFK